jgi:hypothetical protein
MNNKYNKNQYSILETFSEDSDDSDKNNKNKEIDENIEEIEIKSNDYDEHDSHSDSDDNHDDNYNYNDNNDENSLNIRNMKLNKFFNKKKITTNNKKSNFDNKLNHKKIMCQNFIDTNSCIYNEKCLYAHNLQEQKIDIKRRKILDLIESTEDLSYIDPHKNKDIYKDLQLFTKLCTECVNNKCTGGFNCKFGSPSIKFLLCYEDLNYGNCIDKTCTKIHLTKRHLKPQYNNIFSSINKPPINNIQMLTPFMNNISNLLLNLSNISNNNNDFESDDDECEKSIFIEKINFDEEFDEKYNQDFDDDIDDFDEKFNQEFKFNE